MSRWYIIHAYSGFENKVRDAIMSDAKRLGLEPAGRGGRGADREGHRGPPRQEGHLGHEILPGLCARQAGDERRRLSPRQEHAEGDRLPRLDGQAAADLAKPRPRASSTPRTRPPRPRPRRRSASITRSATMSRCSTARSRASTASSRNSISTAAGSRSRSRSSAARPRSSWSSNRSNLSNKLRSIPDASGIQSLTGSKRPGRKLRLFCWLWGRFHPLRIFQTSVRP